MSAEGEKDTLHVFKEKKNSHQKIHKTKGWLFMNLKEEIC